MAFHSDVEIAVGDGRNISEFPSLCSALPEITFPCVCLHFLGLIEYYEAVSWRYIMYYYTICNFTILCARVSCTSV